MGDPIAAPAASAAGMALNAAVALGNFVYTIVKDHGHETKFTPAAAGAGLSTIPDGMPVRIVGRYEHGSAWYTHTRAWHSAIHSLYSHDKDPKAGQVKNPKDLKSTYLCMVFPFKVTYAVAVPDGKALNAEIAKLELDIAQERLKIKREVAAQLKELRKAKDKELPAEPERPEEPKGYRTPDERSHARHRKDRHATEAEAEYEEELETYNEDYAEYEEAYAKYKKDYKRYKEEKKDYELEVATLADIKEGIRALVPAVDGHLKGQIALLERKKQFRDDVATLADVKYMTDVRIHAADGFNGLKSKSWQNVKVTATMTLSANVAPEGESPTVTVALDWAEKAIGYGKSWTGTITLAPAQPAVTGEGKFLQRFNRYAVLQPA